MDRIQILYAGSMGISDDLITFLHVPDGGHFEKMAAQKVVGAISYDLLVGSHSNLTWWFSWYF